MRPLLGRVSRDRFAVRRYTPWFRNTYFPEVSGDLSPTTDGTEIRVRIGISRVAAWLTLVWLLAMLALFLGLLLSALATTPDTPAGAQGAPLLGALVALLLLLLGCGMVLLGRWLSRSDGVFVLGVLADALEAREADPSEAGWPAQTKA